jgi:HEAT repeat protein
MLVRGSRPWRAGCGLLGAACLLLQVRASAAQASTPTDFISRLIEQLGAPDPAVRTQAADDLWQLSNDPRAIEPLLVNLKDQNRQLSRFAGFALARIGPPAVPSLLELLHDPDAHMRLKALDAIATIQDTRVMPAIEAALQDENPNVRDEAMQAIAQYGDEAREKVLVNLLAHAPQKEWFHDESAFTAAGPAAIGPLMELLRSGQAEDRLRAAMALSNVGFSNPRQFSDDPSVVDMWLNGWRPVLKDPNARLRSDAVAALRHARDPRVVPDLLQLRMDPDPPGPAILAPCGEHA